MNYCGDCGSRLHENAAFCGECGTGVERTNGTQIIAKPEPLTNELYAKNNNGYDASAGQVYRDYSHPSSINIVMASPEIHSGFRQSSVIYDAKKKSTLVAYILWFIFGGLGVHRFYVHRSLSALIMLSMLIFGLLFSFIYVGVPVFIVVAIWWVLDAALITGMVRSYNLELAQNMGH